MHKLESVLVARACATSPQNYPNSVAIVVQSSSAPLIDSGLLASDRPENVTNPT
jgi:hypothetical protein